MMAGGAKVVIGADIKDVQPALDSVVRSVKEGAAAANGSFQGWVGNSNAVATATEKLERQLKGFASEQRQQGRMARFYAGEIASIIPAASGAKSAIEGLAGVAIEGIAGGLSFGFAFEAIKFGVQSVTEEMKRAALVTKNLEDANLAAATITEKGWDRARGMMERVTEGTKAYRDALKDVQPELERVGKAVGEVQAQGPGMAAYARSFFGDPAAFTRWVAAYEAAAAASERASNAAQNQAEIARALATEKQKAAQAGLADAAIVKVEAEAEERRKKNIDLLNLEIAALLARNKALRDGLTLLPREVPEMPGIKEIAGGFPLAGPGNDQGALGFRLDSAKVDEQTAKANELAAAGDSIAASFGAAGAAIGGMAGSIIAQIANIVTLTLKFIGLAIAASAASAAQTPIVGPWAAIAGGVAVAAALFSLIVGLADGGPMQGGRPYLVGERGPELVVPSSSGTVIPNHMLGGGGIVLNINGPTDGAWWRSNERHIVRTLREASRSGRGA